MKITFRKDRDERVSASIIKEELEVQTESPIAKKKKFKKISHKLNSTQNAIDKLLIYPSRSEVQKISRDVFFFK